MTTYLTAVEECLVALGRLATERGIPQDMQPPHIQAIRATVMAAWHLEVREADAAQAPSVKI